MTTLDRESYSLREVAELFGISKRAIQAQIRDGAFPGRFVAPSTEGLETRIPRDEIRDFLETQPPVQSEISVVVPLAGGDTQSDSLAVRTTSTPTALTKNDLVCAIREERAAFLEAIENMMSRRDDELDALRTQMRDVRQALDKLRHGVGQTQSTQPQEENSMGMDDVMDELDALAALVQDLSL